MFNDIYNQYRINRASEEKNSDIWINQILYIYLSATIYQ